MSEYNPDDHMRFVGDFAVALGETVFHRVLFDAFPPRPDARVLEIGCGTGKLGLGYALRGCETVVLADIDPEIIRYSRRLLQAARTATGLLLQNVVHVKGVDIHDLGRFVRDGDLYDFVFNEGVLEHFYRTDADGGFLAHDVAPLRSMVSVAKPGGTVAAIVPNAAHPESQRVSREVHHHYVGMPEKEVPFTEEQLRDLFAEAGIPEVRFWWLGAAPTAQKPEGLQMRYLRYIMAAGEKA